jgi:cellulose synthase/poly-beta-1,6-N-acetylglucosamine synthase-like glycosyltransferase
MTRANWSIGVVIPAQNEQATIAQCIQSVFAAAKHIGVRDALWIVVVADACTDATAEIARQSIGCYGQVITCAVKSAGTARKLGVNAALTHFYDVESHWIWLANTDADTCVPFDWIDIHLELANKGVVGVAGIVELAADGCQDAHTLYNKTYAIEPDGTHRHVHGANIAMRADAYLDVGGWRDLGLAEDHCLWGRLRSRGWRLSSPANSVVVTSARLQGRARGGFADTLRAGISVAHD